ncbi:MAG: amidohydrolase family protein [Planctomycetaceae bacterium]
MDWQLLDRDRDIWDRELASFVPPRVFDSHLHLYELSHFTGPPPGLCAKGPSRVGWSEFQSKIAEIMPDREVSGLAFGYPQTTVNFEAANSFLANEVQHRGALGQMLIHPAMDPDFIRETVQRDGFVGLKPYHLFATEKPTFDANIPSFLTDEHMQVAHELGLSITLHIVRSQALADPSNQEVLRRYATKYPNARMILAHAARGFNPHHTVVGIESLRGLRNVWFDTSAVTDCGAYEAIIKVMGHDRLMYGSDFPVSHIRGRCVGLGDNFLWLTPENTKLDAAYADVQFTLVGIESLRTLKVAAFACGLSDEQIEDLFFGNGANLFAR